MRGSSFVRLILEGNLAKRVRMADAEIDVGRRHDLNYFYKFLGISSLRTNNNFY